jgi:acyl dehydratase
MIVGKAYDEVAVGDEFTSAMTMTETHLVLGGGLFGDINPLHVNRQYADGQRYGGRIAHGFLTSAFMAAPLGHVFYETAIAYVEHTCRFTAPVRPGDTLHTVWRIEAKEDKPRHKGGLLHLAGSCTNQDGIQVAVAKAQFLTANRQAG